MHFLEWKCIDFNWIFTEFVPQGPINKIPTLVQIIAWRRPGDKPLSEPMTASLLTHICITRPQWNNTQRSILPAYTVHRHYNMVNFFQNTIKCLYNAVQFIILYMPLRWKLHNVNQTLNSQQTRHTSPSRASHEVSIVRIWEKIGHVITASHCTCNRHAI